ncbi:hypothetical protein IFR04_004857 [Cadophora malorum]|uniref:Gfd2/YDR514C-like C-terminal domain-containing protein n=1 Tax=Cadophora malorum TaxID=108018 RepID=A0A8H7WBY4_9HELO|nr:hypothetical protein IFR04_004857 [Cadophora malorum]
MAEEKLRELPGTDSIRLLQRVLMEEVDEIIILSLDFGYSAHEGNKITQIGISTMSTNVWRELSPTEDARIIHSRCVRTPIKSLITSNFLFGESETVYRRNLVDFLRDALAQRSVDGSPQRVVLVGVGTLNELKILKDLGIDLQEKSFFAIEGILDLNAITKTLELPFRNRPSLLRILKHLEIFFREEYLHDSGNDAHFTLRALLMLAAIAFERIGGDEVMRSRVESLKTIALDLIDFSLDMPDEMKRQRRDQHAGKAAEARSRLSPVTGSNGGWLGGDDEEVCLASTLLGVQDLM